MTKSAKVLREPTMRDDLDEDNFDEPRPRRPRRDDEDDEMEDRVRRRRRRDDDDDFDRPRRSRDYEDDDDDEFDHPRRRRRRSRGEDLVVAPGIALLIVGLLGSVFGVLMSAVTAFRIATGELGREAAADANGDNAYIVGYYVGAIAVPVVFAIWSIVLVGGGRAMMRRSSYSAALTAAIVAMLPCNFGCLGGLPIGIWALVVLCMEDVRREFR